ncbi:unnamed protein product [Effrenium voratum]|nr:unnamed protein product [Effrenium voratum]
MLRAMATPGVGVPADWRVPSDWHQVAKIPMDSLRTNPGTVFAYKGNKSSKRSNNSSSDSTCDSDDGSRFGYGTVRPPPGLEHLGPCPVGLAQSLRETCPGEVTGVCKKWRKPKVPQYGFAVTFEEFDAVTHKNFEFVERIFGRKGVNVKRISGSADAKVRLMGEGSGYKEQQGQLHLVVICPSQEKEDLALRLTILLFDNLRTHFSRFCRKEGLPPVKLYKVISLEEARTR